MGDKKYGFSIIVPAVDEAETINAFIEHLRFLTANESYEIIVVDGDPDCKTAHAISDKGIVTISSERGRAQQMNSGAAVANGDILIFLHADTELPPHAFEKISSIMKQGQYVGGAFDLGIKSNRLIFKLIAHVASLRSRLTRIPYGDQAIFFRRDYFLRIGGYREMPLMEDIEIMQRVKRRGGKISIIPDRVNTSPRRWEKEGVIYCTVRNWLLSSLFYMGVSPKRLSKFYLN